MSQRIEGQTVYVKFPTEQLAELDRIAKRLELKRADIIRNLVGVGIDIFHGYEKIGVVKLHEIQKRAIKALNKEIQPTLFKK